MEFRTTHAQGILYAEDFDLDPAAQAPEPPPPPEPPPYEPPPLTQADIDDACIRAVEAARATWTRSDEQQRTETLAAIAAALATSRTAATEHVEAVADGIARTALSMVAGALPHLCRTHGDAETRVIVQRLAPMLASRRLVIRAHAGLIETLRADLETLDDTLNTQVELRPANLQPGDVRLTWEDGVLARDTNAVLAAMSDSLSQLGLLESVPPTPTPQASTPQTTENRSLALAQ